MSFEGQGQGTLPRGACASPGVRRPCTGDGALIALRPRLRSRPGATAAILATIEEHRDSGPPSFAHPALQAPHDPFQSPADWRDR